MNEKKLQDSKNKIHEAMKPYIDTNKCIDISAFRQANPQKYGLLPHYFGSVDNALVELGLVKVQIVRQKCSNHAMSFKDKLALDMLNHLRKTEGESLETIAQRYGVTRPLVNQLHKTLKSAAEQIGIEEEIAEEVNDG
jgi:hypothetical protein